MHHSGESITDRHHQQSWSDWRLGLRAEIVEGDRQSLALTRMC